MTPRSAGIAQLQDIASGLYSGRTSRDDARSAVGDVVLGCLGCSRVSLWRFDAEPAPQPGLLTLRCFGAKRAGGALTHDGTRLDQAEFGAYFEALVRRGVYVSDDALADPALQPMRTRYLLPNGVLSMLDAAVMVNGRSYGVVCCEQTDAPRHWRAAEVGVLRELVSKLALLMASNGDAALWDSASVPMAPLRSIR